MEPEVEHEEEGEEDDEEDPPEASNKHPKGNPKIKEGKDEGVRSGTRLSVGEFKSFNEIIMDNFKTFTKDMKPDHTAIITAALAHTSRAAPEKPSASTAAAEQLVLLNYLAGILRGFPIAVPG